MYDHCDKLAWLEPGGDRPVTGRSSAGNRAVYRSVTGRSPFGHRAIIGRLPNKKGVKDPLKRGEPPPWGGGVPPLWPSTTPGGATLNNSRERRGPIRWRGLSVRLALVSKTQTLQKSGKSQVQRTVTQKSSSAQHGAAVLCVRGGSELLPKPIIQTMARGGGVDGGENQGKAAAVGARPIVRSTGAAQRARTGLATPATPGNVSCFGLGAHRSVTGRSPGGRWGQVGGAATLLRGVRGGSAGVLDVR
jgi:hypothetical protein